MRLARVSTGHRLKEKLIISAIRLVTRHEPPDVVKTVFYRPELFGRPFGRWLQSVLRGPSPWSVGERELFAAFTSRLNQCVF